MIFSQLSDLRLIQLLHWMHLHVCAIIFLYLGGINIGAYTSIIFNVLKEWVHVEVHTGASFPFLSNYVKGMAITTNIKINLP